MHIEHVRKGMHVIELSGANVGVVEDLKFGDADVKTNEGEDDRRVSGDSGNQVVAAPMQGFPTVVDLSFTKRLDLAQLPSEHADRLLLDGYIRVKTGHILHGVVRGAVG